MPVPRGVHVPPITWLRSTVAPVFCSHNPYESCPDCPPTSRFPCTRLQLPFWHHTAAESGGHPPDDPPMAALSSTSHCDATPPAFAPQNTPNALFVCPSAAPLIALLESITGWQSPTECTPSDRGGGTNPPAPCAAITVFPEIRGAFPPQSSAQIPCESTVPPAPMMLFPRMTTWSPLPLMRI